MTKKDYIIIAKAINELYMGHNDWQRSQEQVINKLAEHFAKDNDKFDKERFIKECNK